MKQQSDTAPKAGPYQLFMLGLCVYVLLALAAETFFPLDEDSKTVLNYVDTGICIIFLVDFFVQLIRAEKKLAYLKWGWIDLVSSIPMIGPLRLGRAARIFRILRLLRGVRSSKRLVSYILQKRAQSAFLAAALVTIIFIAFSSIFILQFESSEGSNISTPEDALWWSFVTVTTVGYGDKFPISTGGRIIAVILMTAGVGLFGTFTGFIATWFLGSKDKEQEQEIKILKSELGTIRRLLEDMKGRHDSET